jgi:hypothetical protein
MSSNTPLVEQAAPFQRKQNLGKNKNMVMGPDGTQKLRFTVLASARSNLLDPSKIFRAMP